jgi:hypothetical protein
MSENQGAPRVAAMKEPFDGDRIGTMAFDQFGDAIEEGAQPDRERLRGPRCGACREGDG